MFRTFLLIIFLVIAASSALAASIPLFDADALTQRKETLTPFDVEMRKAFDALSRKDVAAAHRFFDAAAKIDPKSVEPYLGHAEAARVAQKSKDIESALEKALEVGPRNPDALAAWSRWYFAKGDLDAAENYLRRAIDAKPDYARLHVDLGDLYLNGRRNPNDAAREYRKATTLDSASVNATAGLGSALLAQGDKTGALKAFEHATELAPQNALPYIALARIHGSERHYKEAERNFAKALSLQPGLVAIMVERADTLLLDSRRDEAIAVYRDAVKADEGNAVIRAKLGMALQQAGKTADAFNAYEQVLKLQPRSPVVLNNLAVLAIESNTRMNEAPAWASKAVQLAPKEATYVDTQAWVLQASGKKEEALKLINENLGKLPPSAPLQYRRARILEETGKSAEALEAYRAALQIEPNFESARDAANRINKLSKK